MFETPNHSFQGERIAEEGDLVSRYGLSNKEELWRAQSELRDYRREARRLLGEAQGDAEAAGEAGSEFMARLKRIGVLDDEETLDDVLSLDVTDILERRLQTIAYRQGLANTAEQARQFIVHGHVTVDGARVNAPSYKIDVTEEDRIEFDDTSPLADDLHPERAEDQ